MARVQRVLAAAACAVALTSAALPAPAQPAPAQSAPVRNQPAAPNRTPGPLPVSYSGVLALLNAAVRPDTDPPGSNNWSCRPSAAHPRPVVLVHGTIDNKTYDWNALSPLLHNLGYCVFALNYGAVPGPHVGLPGSLRTYGAAPVASSAAELARYVDRVRRATHTAQVDIVGHSQGGMMPRYYLKFLGGAGKVHALVGLAPSNHGTTVDGLALLPGVVPLLSAGLGPSVQDQIAGSAFLRKLNAGSPTVPGVAYTVIETDLDEVVTPYTAAFLDDPYVNDLVLQAQCDKDFTDHLGITFDPIALHDVTNALDPAHATPPNCRLVLPVDGGGLSTPLARLP